MIKKSYEDYDQEKINILLDKLSDEELIMLRDIATMVMFLDKLNKKIIQAQTRDI